jgi:nucleotide-binding universal stress UspA family protein
MVSSHTTRRAGLLRDKLLIHARRSGRSSNLTALQEFLDPATAREMRVVSDSSPARGLQAIAEEAGASLIVVGSSHRSGIGRVFAGGVAESLLDGAPVPIAVAPHGYASADNRLGSVSRALVRSAACPVVVVRAGSAVAHHADPAALAITQPDPGA